MMDSAYGNHDDGLWSQGSADQGIETPVVIGNDERRMHVRAYNYWVSMLGDRCFPSIEDLEPEKLHDFGPNSVLLDFTANCEDPTIQFLGISLRHECGLDESIKSISQVPSRSLLSRLTDHYLQIIANRAPVGFEAEFVNHRGNNTMYRGILMPFSSDDDTIDFIYGVINWKELADPELVTQINDEIARVVRPDPAAISDASWADGPAAPLHHEEPALPQHDPAPMQFTPFDDAAELDRADELDLADIDIGPDAGIGDHLAAARCCAEMVQHANRRARAALYRALGLAWDFALIAERKPDEYAELLEDYGLKVQQRAPMTAVIKLIFGADYDKSRVTEFAATLDHAGRLGIAMGGLTSYLESVEGGIKGIVKAEREARRGENPAPAKPKRQHSAQATLASHQPVAVLDLDAGTSEFVVMLGCRTADGRVALLAPVEADEAMVGRMIKAIDSQ